MTSPGAAFLRVRGGAGLYLPIMRILLTGCGRDAVTNDGREAEKAYKGSGVRSSKPAREKKGREEERTTHWYAADRGMRVSRGLEDTLKGGGV